MNLWKHFCIWYILQQILHFLYFYNLSWLKVAALTKVDFIRFVKIVRTIELIYLITFTFIIGASSLKKRVVDRTETCNKKEHKTNYDMQGKLKQFIIIYWVSRNRFLSHNMYPFSQESEEILDHITIVLWNWWFICRIFNYISLRIYLAKERF